MQVHVVERPGAAIVDRHVERRREPCDPQALRDAAADRDVRLQHVDRFRQQQVAEAKQQPLVLPAGERNADAAQVRHLRGVVLRRGGSSKKPMPQGFTISARSARMIEIEIAVRVDEQLDVGADSLAHRAHARRILLDDVMQRALVAPPQRLVADRHLQPREALRDPMLGGGGKLRAVEESKAERRIDRHALARAAEQAPHRLAERLALDVPQRKVDRRDRMRRIAGLAAWHRLPVELFPDRLVRHRVVADDRRTRDAVHDLCDHVFLGDRREAMPDDAARGLDLDVHAGE